MDMKEKALHAHKQWKANTVAFVSEVVSQAVKEHS